MNIGFTGTRQGMTLPQKIAVTHLLSELLASGSDSAVRHGCCVGADYDFMKIAWRAATKIRIVGCPSDYPDMLCDGLDLCDELMTPAPPLDRNKIIVDNSEVMIACPNTDTEEQRSGTWMTIRYARKKISRGGLLPGLKLLIIVWPDGSVVKEEPS